MIADLFVGGWTTRSPSTRGLPDARVGAATRSRFGPRRRGLAGPLGQGPDPCPGTVRLRSLFPRPRSPTCPDMCPDTSADPCRTCPDTTAEEAADGATATTPPRRSHGPRGGATEPGAATRTRTCSSPTTGGAAQAGATRSPRRRCAAAARSRRRACTTPSSAANPTECGAASPRRAAAAEVPGAGPGGERRSLMPRSKNSRKPSRPDRPVLLDWSHRDHWASRERPCRYCEQPTHLRDSSRKPAHKVCAEAAVIQQASEYAEAWRTKGSNREHRPVRRRTHPHRTADEGRLRGRVLHPQPRQPVRLVLRTTRSLLLSAGTKLRKRGARRSPHHWPQGLTHSCPGGPSPQPPGLPFMSGGTP